MSRSHANIMNIDRLMLERSITKHVTDDLSSHDNDNPHLDFNLFDKIKPENTLIDCSETTCGDFSNLDDGTKQTTQSNDPYATCITDINSTTACMHSNMYMVSKSDYIISGFGIFSVFGALYLVSRGKTERVLKNYFGFQEKKYLNAGILTFGEKIHGTRDQFIFDNYLIYDDTMTVNKNTIKNIKTLLTCVSKNSQNSKEFLAINHMINKSSHMNSALSARTLSRSSAIILSITRIKPRWKYGIDKIQKHNSKTYVSFINKTFDYFEDRLMQIVEVPLSGDLFVFGIIISKHQIKQHTDIKTLTTAINYMKSITLQEVMFPLINHRYKTRLVNILHKTGLGGFFKDHELKNLFPNGDPINDCLQYVDVLMNMKSDNIKSNDIKSNDMISSKKVIANNTFEYYIRDVETNCLFVMGRF